jgi:hypothetical protein
VVPPAGIEPARLSALDFESSASTNSATEAASAGAHISTWNAKLTRVRAPPVGAGGVPAYDLAYLSKRAVRQGGLYDEE